MFRFFIECVEALCMIATGLFIVYADMGGPHWAAFVTAVIGGIIGGYEHRLYRREILAQIKRTVP